MKNISIRFATPKDASSLLSIYAPYVRKTSITYEYEVPSMAEFERRIRHVTKSYPYLVAESDGEPLGYAYADRFHERQAYDWSVETTLYIREDCRNMGLGKLLYDTLEKILKVQNIVNVNACIAYPPTEDEYLTQNSVNFHRHMGYHLVGEFKKSGYKFGRWYSTVWMDKQIGIHQDVQPPLLPIDEVREFINKEYGIM